MRREAHSANAAVAVRRSLAGAQAVVSTSGRTHLVVAPGTVTLAAATNVADVSWVPLTLCGYRPSPRWQAAPDLYQLPWCRNCDQRLQRLVLAFADLLNERQTRPATNRKDRT